MLKWPKQKSVQWLDYQWMVKSRFFLSSRYKTIHGGGQPELISIIIHIIIVIIAVSSCDQAHVQDKHECVCPVCINCWLNTPQLLFNKKRITITQKYQISKQKDAFQSTHSLNASSRFKIINPALLGFRYTHWISSSRKSLAKIGWTGHCKVCCCCLMM